MIWHMQRNELENDMGTTDKVRLHRARLRAEGLRPFQMWVPDTRSTKFAEKIRQQARKLRNDPTEREILEQTDEVISTTEGWVLHEAASLPWLFKVTLESHVQH